MLTEAHIQRYARHILLDDMGGVGQAKLLQAKIRVVGRGDALATALLYLVAAGIGRLDLQLLDDPATGGDAADASLMPHLLANPHALVQELSQLNDDCAISLLNATERTAFEGDLILLAGLAPTHPIWQQLGKLPGPLTVLGVWPGGEGAYLANLTLPDEALWAEVVSQISQITPVELPAEVVPPLLGQMGSVMATEAIKYLLQGPGRSPRLLTLQGVTGRYQLLIPPA
uniref:Putative dinucleotide-utilizing enzymes involved in molybdopterin and thiamine biosynthesis family 2 n=1 Tax=Magnetococcus massalia (strain MO-1) TaxID=451514 RepID=A0A1S7LLH1_MAGMO|nr:Putative dinucleotide-utilizing enzymes involved in molybdopterin and thiamine biosynthesis family 2 [Candidatus Magnetococcus massalia]